MAEPTMNPMNQYAAPTTHVADMAPSAGVAEMNLFSAKGRIGRLRYLAYGGGMSLVYVIVATVLSIFFVRNPMLMGIATFALGVAMIWFSIIFGIKRCHDMNLSGWWCLTVFIPFVALVWLLAPGTKGENRFGPPPPPNNWGVRVLAFAPLILIGILAAIAIPQYQAYVEKAKARAAQEQQQQQQPPATN